MLLCFALLCVTSGCVVGPDYAPPRTPVPDQWHQELQEGSFANAAELRHWWRVLEDPYVADLIARAERKNRDLYVAYQRICQARAQVRIARSARLLSADATGAFNNAKPSNSVANFLIGARDIWSLNADLSWEVDVFGSVSRQIESASADTAGTVEAYRDVLVTLYGDVVSNYVNLRTLQAQLEFALLNAEIQRQSLELATKRVVGGVSPILDQHQAESNLATTEATDSAT